MLLARGPRHSPMSCTQALCGQDGMQAGKAAGQAGHPGTSSTGWEPVGQMCVDPHAALPSPHTSAGGAGLHPQKWTQRKKGCAGELVLTCGVAWFYTQTLPVTCVSH